MHMKGENTAEASAAPEIRETGKCRELRRVSGAKSNLGSSAGWETSLVTDELLEAQRGQV